uniref:Protein TsetseEP domain-containing protein n=1 Tax=Graphocephala atropunctata TaxID=36148 RepID=A0A1B6M8W3_9HEMI
MTSWNIFGICFIMMAVCVGVYGQIDELALLLNDLQLKLDKVEDALANSDATEQCKKFVSGPSAMYQQKITQCRSASQEHDRADCFNSFHETKELFDSMLIIIKDKCVGWLDNK